MILLLVYLIGKILLRHNYLLTKIIISNQSDADDPEMENDDSLFYSQDSTMKRMNEIIRDIAYEQRMV